MSVSFDETEGARCNVPYDVKSGKQVRTLDPPPQLKKKEHSLIDGFRYIVENK